MFNGDPTNEFCIKEDFLEDNKKLIIDMFQYTEKELDQKDMNIETHREQVAVFCALQIMSNNSNYKEPPDIENENIQELTSWTNALLAKINLWRLLERGLIEYDYKGRLSLTKKLSLEDR